MRNITLFFSSFLFLVSCGDNEFHVSESMNVRNDDASLEEKEVGIKFVSEELALAANLSARLSQMSVDWHVHCNESGGVVTNTKTAVSVPTLGTAVTMTVRASCQSPDVRFNKFNLRYQPVAGAAANLAFTSVGQILTLGSARIQLLETTPSPANRKTLRTYKIQEVTNQAAQSSNSSINGQNVSVTFSAAPNRLCSDISITSPAGNPVVVAKFDDSEIVTPGLTYSITAVYSGLPAEVQSTVSINQAAKTVSFDFSGILPQNLGSPYSWTMNMAETSAPPSGETANNCTGTITVTPTANASADFN